MDAEARSDDLTTGKDITMPDEKRPLIETDEARALPPATYSALWRLASGPISMAGHDGPGGGPIPAEVSGDLTGRGWAVASTHRDNPVWRMTKAGVLSFERMTNTVPWMGGVAADGEG